MSKRSLRTAVTAFLGLAACNLCMAAGNGAVGAGANWVYHNGDRDETAYSRLHQLDTSNIGRLGLAWSLDLPGDVTLEATPLAVHGVLYFTGTYGSVYAVDGLTGKVLWKHDPKTWKYYPNKMMFTFAANRGVAYAHGRIFSAALDGRLFALDARTGKLLWSVVTVSPASMQDVTGAPRVFDGKVIIGSTGADFGARGYVTAYDQKTGREAWRVYTVPGAPAENKGHPAMERAAATWSGSYWKTGTGGGVWDSMTFDPGLNLIYLGTANAGPYDPTLRSPGSGVNLYTDSIIAIDASSGKFVWADQLVPRDAWDYDCTQQMTLADLMIDGRKRKVLMQAPKDGFLYVIDRKTGKLISAGKIGKATWARRIDVKTGRPVLEPGIYYDKTGQATIWPAPVGAHSWQSMSYDPATGLLYIPYMQLGVRYTKNTPASRGFTVGDVTISGYKAGPHDGKGALLAWDPVHQRRAWEIWHDAIWNGGVLSTAGGLVFQGEADGYFNAYDAKTGKRLWHFNAGLGIIAAPMSYAVGGKQYVSVLVGYGGSAAAWGSWMNVGWKFGAQPRRLLTFALGGRETLPPSPGPDMTVHALDNPSYKINPVQVAMGHALFIACAACHGRNLVSPGAPGPDLRESPVALHRASLWAVVHDGALIQHGMPRFATLTRAQVDDIYAYIRAGARAALAHEKSSGSAANDHSRAPAATRAH